MGIVRCAECGAENTAPEGGAPFFCRECKQIIDPEGKRKAPPPPTVPGSAQRSEGPAFVSQYKTTAPRDATGPGAGFSIGGNRALGYVLAALAAAVVGGGLGWIGLHYLNVPIVYAFLAGWAIRRALAAGSGGGTPDRGPLGLLVLTAIVVATFGVMRYVTYVAVARHQSQRYAEIYGPTPTQDVEATILEMRARDPDRDGSVLLSDDTTFRLDDEEQRLRAAAATGVRPNDAYDVALLAESGHAGFRGHLLHVLANGTTFRFTPLGRSIPVPGYGVVLWWIAELLVLALSAFTKVD